MNEANYRMDYDERKQYALDAFKLYLDNNDDAFVEAVNELIRYNGFIDTQVFSIDMIDEICGDMKPSELINKMTSDFNSNDDYFYFSIYGLESCDDVAALYRGETTVDDVVNELIPYGYSMSFSDDGLSEFVDIFANDDFGIEDGWEYSEYDDEEDEPEETDEEFKNRIDSI